MPGFVAALRRRAAADRPRRLSSLEAASARAADVARVLSRCRRSARGWMSQRGWRPRRRARRRFARPALPVGSRNELLDAARRSFSARRLALLADLPRAPGGRDLRPRRSGADTRRDAGLGSDPSTCVSARKRAALAAAVPGALDTDGAIASTSARCRSRAGRDAVASDVLPERVRRAVALAGWTRATLLADSAAAASFAQCAARAGAVARRRSARRGECAPGRGARVRRRVTSWRAARPAPLRPRGMTV